MKKLPNVFIVGAAKCGTTSLHYWLSQHPEIFMSDPKELRYWCFDLHAESDRFHFGRPPVVSLGAIWPFLHARRWIAHKWSTSHHGFPIRTLDNYLKAFEGCENYEYAGESSPDYLWSRRAASEIWKFNAEAFILILVRDPVDFIVSLYFEQQSGRRGETSKNFTQALRLEECRRRGYKIPYRARFPATLFYRENAKFSQQIKRFLNYFPKSQVKMLTLGDLKCNPERTYASILEFLGVKDKNFVPDFASRNIKEPSYLGRLSSEDKNTIDILKKDFKDEIYILSDLLNRDLTSAWGN